MECEQMFQDQLEVMVTFANASENEINNSRMMIDKILQKELIGSQMMESLLRNL